MKFCWCYAHTKNMCFYLPSGLHNFSEWYFFFLLQNRLFSKEFSMSLFWFKMDWKTRWNKRALFLVFMLQDFSSHSLSQARIFRHSLSHDPLPLLQPLEKHPQWWWRGQRFTVDVAYWDQGSYPSPHKKDGAFQVVQITTPHLCDYTHMLLFWYWAIPTLTPKNPTRIYLRILNMEGFPFINH